MIRLPVTYSRRGIKTAEGENMQRSSLDQSDRVVETFPFLSGSPGSCLREGILQVPTWVPVRAVKSCNVHGCEVVGFLRACQPIKWLIQLVRFSRLPK